jgi:oligoribonuclease NrnB/cAMP/cGMP phosphodiesterase (DHH superfamily)
MTVLPRPEAIFTHESDLDGLVAGVLLKRLAAKLFNADVPLYAYHYNAWKMRDCRERAAWVADLAFEPRLDRANWAFFDHHVTDARPKQAQLIHDIEKSAGRIVYDVCNENGIQSPEMDRLVRLSNIADLFLEDDPEFIIAGDYANLVKTYGFWNLHTLVKGKIECLLDNPLMEIMDVKRRIEDPIGFAWSRDNVVEIAPTVGYVETVVGNNNLIVHRMLEEKVTPYPVLITLFRRSNGVVIASLRSRNGEAMKMAARLQGGGHANAAAAMLPKSVRNIPEAIDYLRKTLNPKPGTQLNSLESLFAAIESESK